MLADPGTWGDWRSRRGSGLGEEPGPARRQRSGFV